LLLLLLLEDEEGIFASAMAWGWVAGEATAPLLLLPLSIVADVAPAEERASRLLWWPLLLVFAVFLDPGEDVGNVDSVDGDNAVFFFCAVGCRGCCCFFCDPGGDDGNTDTGDEATAAADAFIDFAVFLRCTDEDEGKDGEDGDDGGDDGGDAEDNNEGVEADLDSATSGAATTASEEEDDDDGVDTALAEEVVGAPGLGDAVSGEKTTAAGAAAGLADLGAAAAAEGATEAAVVLAVLAAFSFFAPVASPPLGAAATAPPPLGC